MPSRIVICGSERSYIGQRWLGMCFGEHTIKTEERLDVLRYQNIIYP